MSDAIASQSALDPNRPWITDAEQLPSKMNWFDTFFNPTGKTPTLHFTRAWTVLFMAQLISVFFIGWLLTGIISIAGADTEALEIGEGYFIALVFVITTVLSYIIHVRRLNHAGRSPLWAIIVLIPVLVALAQFTGTLVQKSAEYDELYSARTEFLEDPAAWRANKLVEQREAQEKAVAERAKRREEAPEVPEMCKAANANSGGGGGGNRGPGGRGGFGDRGPNAEQPLATKEKFILRPAAAGVVQPIMMLSLPIMIWTLLWVARAPLHGAQYPKRGIAKILTTPTGRISRLQYIAGLVTILILGGIVFIVQGIVAGIAPPVAALVLLALVPLLWFGFSITSKRLHDLGKSAFFMAWPWIFSAGVAVFTALIVFLNMQAFMFAQTCGGDMPIAVLAAFILLGITVVCGHLGMLFMLCTAGPDMRDNKHGAAPIPGDTGAQYPEGYQPGMADGGTFAS